MEILALRVAAQNTLWCSDREVNEKKDVSFSKLPYVVIVYRVDPSFFLSTAVSLFTPAAAVVSRQVPTSSILIFLVRERRREKEESQETRKGFLFAGQQRSV